MPVVQSCHCVRPGLPFVTRACRLHRDARGWLTSAAPLEAAAKARSRFRRYHRGCSVTPTGREGPGAGPRAPVCALHRLFRIVLMCKICFARLLRRPAAADNVLRSRDASCRPMPVENVPLDPVPSADGPWPQDLQVSRGQSCRTGAHSNFPFAARATQRRIRLGGSVRAGQLT